MIVTRGMHGIVGVSMREGWITHICKFIFSQTHRHFACIHKAVHKCTRYMGRVPSPIYLSFCFIYLSCLSWLYCHSASHQAKNNFKVKILVFCQSVKVWIHIRVWIVTSLEFCLCTVHVHMHGTDNIQYIYTYISEKNVTSVGFIHDCPKYPKWELTDYHT